MIVRINPWTVVNLFNSTMTITRRIAGNTTSIHEALGFNVVKMNTNYYAVHAKLHLTTCTARDITKQHDLFLDALKHVKEHGTALNDESLTIPFTRVALGAE